MVTRWKDALEKIDDRRWLLPEKHKPGMRVPGLVFASEEMLGVIGQDQALEQVANVAFLPGIVKYSMAMPDIPAGVGGHGLLRVSLKEIDDVMVRGAHWALEHGYAWPEDVESVEGGGALKGANPDKVSHRAKQRGAPQLGTLGSGNHFPELQVIDEVFDAEKAEAMGIEGPGQVMVFIHCGSRGLGHQICTDCLEVMEEAAQKYRIQLPAKQ